MSASDPLPRLPSVLLIALSIVSFGGPFVMVGVIRAGGSPGWPPDRPIEWLTAGVVLTLFLILFVACVTLSAWFRPGTKLVSRGDRKKDHCRSSSRPGQFGE